MGYTGIRRPGLVLTYVGLRSAIEAMATEVPVGTRIKKRRQVLGLTQQQLAERLDVNRSTVADWERGKHFPLRYLGKVEDVLGISLSDDGPEPPVIPPDLQRRIDALSPDERRYVIDRLTRRNGGSGSAGQAPG